MSKTKCVWGCQSFCWAACPPMGPAVFTCQGLLCSRKVVNVPMPLSRGDAEINPKVSIGTGMQSATKIGNKGTVLKIAGRNRR